MDTTTEQPVAQALDSTATGQDSTTGEDADPDEALIEQIEPQPAATDDDEVEDDLDGVKVRGKKEQIERIKSERLMQSDYTRKTQAVAAEREQLKQQAEFQGAFLREAAALQAVDMRLAEFDQVDWPELINADPQRAALLRHQRDELGRARQQALESLNAKHAHTLQQQQAGLAQLKEQAAAFIAREVPGWSPERDAAVLKYVVKAGVPAAAIPNVIAHMPQWAIIADKAERYDSLLAKAAKKQPPSEQPAPVTRIAATKGTANKDPSRMTDAEFAQWRKRQIAQRS